MQTKQARSRKQRELEFRRTLILDGVERTFTELGFYGASVDEIAARAEVAPATLYNLFGGKEELFAAVVERRMEEFLRSVEGARPAGSAAEQLAEVVKAAFSYFDEHEASFRVYLATTHGVPWNIRLRLGKRSYGLYQEFVSYVERVCRQAIGKKGKPARTRAVAFVGALNATIADWITRPHRAPVQKAWLDAWSIIQRLLASDKGLE